ncbi:homocysteine S-methyltransferase [bacterium]|nr:homocysteine S-methyltransferase [bacterium]
MVLDGGLASELEKRGYDLRHRLWSARLLMSDPQTIHDVHRSYLEAGTDCITAATYQATIPGFVAEGQSTEQAESFLRSAVALAGNARDEFVMESSTDSPNPTPLVAASIGPYGAFLADGSEYRGDYDISKAALRDFHRSRWNILADSGADLFACETIPSYSEAEVLRDLIDETRHICCWVSFSCRDGRHISDGTSLAECAAVFEGCPQVIAVGVNCTAPRYISSLIDEIRLSKSHSTIVAYPNSGELYDPKQRRWVGNPEPIDFVMAALEWKEKGARLIGGCCRTGPAHIRALRAALVE